jgi:LytS/YehU family sensor histidine kinase
MPTTYIYLLIFVFIMAVVLIGYAGFVFLKRASTNNREKKVLGKRVEKLLLEKEQLQAQLLSNRNTKVASNIGYINPAAEQEWLKEKKILESEKKEVEIKYAFLRSQVNPHFLQNTFNFFYARALKANDESLSEGIITLSDMMRYALQPTKEANETVLLKEELKHIENVIKINQLRFSHKLQINYQIHVDEKINIPIVPLVLITLVENALKHGELYDTAHPVDIRLEVSTKKDQLKFVVQNKIKTGPKEQGHGISLHYIKWKLDTMYGQHYELTTTSENNLFKAVFIIHSLSLPLPGTDLEKNPLSNKDLPALLDEA